MTAEAAALTGVAAGTPVSGGLHDVTASAVGLGVLGPGALAVTAVDRHEDDGAERPRGKGQREDPE